MKKLVLVIATVILFSGCAIRLSEGQSELGYFKTIQRGMTTHNFIVISNQNAQIIENQEKILANQEKIIKLLEKEKYPWE